VPTFNYSLADFVANTKAKASEVNTKFNDLKTFLNTTKLTGPENIQTGGIATANYADNSVTAEKLAAAIRDALGINTGSTIKRGKSIIDAEESRTSTSYGLMTTNPDRVQNVVLATDGLIVVNFYGQWKSSVAGNSRAAIFVGSQQLRVQYGKPAATSTPHGASAASLSTFYHDIASAGPLGIASFNSGAGTNADPPVTVGQSVGAIMESVNPPRIEVGGDLITTLPQFLGGPTYIFAAAGTYDISIQTKSSSGSCTMKNRKLWVEAIGF
jgi:hypothetical protein